MSRVQDNVPMLLVDNLIIYCDFEGITQLFIGVRVVYENKPFMNSVTEH